MNYRHADSEDIAQPPREMPGPRWNDTMNPIEKKIREAGGTMLSEPLMIGDEINPKCAAQLFAALGDPVFDGPPTHWRSNAPAGLRLDSEETDNL